MEEDTKISQFKICRQCHTIYKKLTQKFCGNGCEKKPPFLQDGERNSEIEPREVNLVPNSKSQIRWMCLNCHREYPADEIQNEEFVCACGKKNDIYPFTNKSCANEKCKEEGSYHPLTLTAKACDLCGESLYIINGTTKVSELKVQKQNKWNGPSSIEFDQMKEHRKVAKNLLILTFIILNNNFKIELDGDNEDITLQDIIQKSNGFVPDKIYLDFLKIYELSTVLFTIVYNEEQNQFTLTSKLNISLNELDGKFRPQTSTIQYAADQQIYLTLNKMYQLRADFFKIQIWVF